MSYGKPFGLIYASQVIVSILFALDRLDGHLKIVVLSPHRDDAAFSLSLSIYDWLRAGIAVEVVNCFTVSEYAPVSAGAFDLSCRSLYVSKQRFLEDQKWAQFMGSGLTFTDLGLKDAPLRLNCSDDRVCEIESAWDKNVQSSIQQALARSGADGIVIPLAVGSHVDHRTVRDTFLCSCQVNGAPFAMYEDLPYAARPNAILTIDPLVGLVSRPLTPCIINPVLLAEAIPFKRHSAGFYSSQIDAGVVELIAQFCTRYNGGERLWATQTWSELFATSSISQGGPAHD